MNRLVTDLFDAWIRETRIEGGTAAFGLNADGMAAVEIDRGIVVNFQSRSSPPLLVLFALVGPLPQPGRNALAEELLEANLMWLGTNGATLSLQRTADGATADVVIAQSITVHQGTAFTELKRVFDNICLVALDWKARLESAQSQPQWPTDQSAPTFGYVPPLA
jgi:Tir chaperone protein (CesT) family